MNLDIALRTSESVGTMSHIEVAKVARKRSDGVKRTLDRLVKAGAISTPQIEELKIKQKNGRITTTKHYMLSRLDSITLMATINPRFCAALVKRWDELERQPFQELNNFSIEVAVSKRLGTIGSKLMNGRKKDKKKQKKKGLLLENKYQLSISLA